MADELLQVRVDDRGLQRDFERAITRVQSPREILDDIGALMLRRTHHRFEVGGYPERWDPKWDGSPSHLRGQGTLQNSVHYRTGSSSVQWGSRHKSARAHQEGMTIRPRRRRYLSIPLKSGRTYQAGAGAWFRRYPGRVFSVFEGGKGTVFLTHPGRKAEPIFLLRRKVKLPRRPFILFTDEDRAAVAATLEVWASRDWR